MKFNELLCNGNLFPVIGCGTDVLLGWNYTNEGRGEKQAAFRVTAEWDGGTYDTGIVASDEMRFRQSDSLPLRPETIYTIRVSAFDGREWISSAPCTLETAADDLGASPWIVCDTEPADVPSAPVFSKFLPVKKPLRRARLYLTALGLFTAAVSGRSVTDARLLPPNTVYQDHCFYETFDITDLLNKEGGLLEVTLGNGYNADFSKFGYRYEGRKGLRALIVLTYRDGSSERIRSGGDWEWRESCITANGLYAGERADSRRTDLPLRAVRIAEEEAPAGRLLPDEMPHVRVVRRLDPVDSRDDGDGGTVYDFGLNIAGVCEITLTADAGTETVLRHCEMLTSDGKPDYETNRGARAEDRYICRGGGETWSPVFTYHGFRYAVIQTVGRCRTFSVRALMLSADARVTGSFACSEPTVNRIHELSVHSLRCNHVSIPTDCPVRDERTPCQMDSQMTELAAMYNFPMQSYYAKWLGDLAAAVIRDGENDPDWQGDIIGLTVRMAQMTGDLRPAERYYSRIMAILRDFSARAEGHLWNKGFGDWCQPNDNTWATVGGSRTAVNTSLWYGYLNGMERFARLYGTPDDVRFLRGEREAVRAAFRALLNEDGSVLDGRQAQEAMPLYHGLVTGDDAVRCAEALAARVRLDGHFDTGGYGTGALPEVLGDFGYADELFGILCTGSYPGYGWQIANGAASLWEQWAWKGIMHSHSHAFFAGVDAAFYRVFCGVRPLADGFRRFSVRPVLPERMRFAACTVGTVSGVIGVRAEKIAECFELTLTVPPNTEAEVTLPAPDRAEEQVLFDGERRIPYAEAFAVPGGCYRFRMVPRRLLHE